MQYPNVAQDYHFQKLVDYFAHQENSGETIHVRLAIQEHKKYLEEWRDGYYRNYTLFWLMVHFTENIIVGGVVTTGLTAGGFLISNTAARQGLVGGISITGLLMAQNVLGYAAGWISTIEYVLSRVDVQISRLENVLAVTR